MPRWRALTLALLLLAGPAAAAEKPDSQAAKPVFSAVVLQKAVLRGAGGAVIAQLQPYDVLQLSVLGRDDIQVLWQDGQGRARQASLAAEAAAIVLGAPAAHQSRLQRIRQAVLPPGIKSRLMAGRIEPGDDMWRVEMAWGRPERSFMVNYLCDEQHFVYLTPGGKPVILRFVGGALAGPLSGHTRAAAAQVESPQRPR